MARITAASLLLLFCAVALVSAVPPGLETVRSERASYHDEILPPAPKFRQRPVEAPLSAESTPNTRPAVAPGSPRRQVRGGGAVIHTPPAISAVTEAKAAEAANAASPSTSGKIWNALRE